MSFRAIRTDINGPFLCLQCNIAVVTQEKEVRCGAAATPNQHSSGLIHGCTTSPIAIDIMALMQCPSALSAPTLMGHFHVYNAILQAPTTMRKVDVVLAATPNLASSGLRRACSTSTIDNDIMALMLCPSGLSAPTLMCHLYAYNSILLAPTTMRRVDVVLAATPNLASSGQLQHRNITVHRG